MLSHKDYDQQTEVNTISSQQQIQTRGVDDTVSVPKVLNKNIQQSLDDDGGDVISIED